MKRIHKHVALLCSIAILTLMITMSPLHTPHIALLAASFIFFNLFLRREKHRRLSIGGLICTLIFIIYALITVLFFIANFFTGNGITFDVLSHLNGHSFSAAFYAFETYQKIALIIIGIFSAMYIIPSRAQRDRPGRSAAWVTSIFLMFALHPFITTSAALFYQLSMSESSGVTLQLITDNRLPDEVISQTRQSLETPPNVLLIYLESMERTYFDDRYYENLMTELEDLSKEAMDFTEVRMPWGATHTIAGMIASLCGVPINAPMGGSHQSGDNDVYMPKAQCLGDITRKLGYFNLFYQGASLSFSNKGGFMRSHGFSEVKGREELQQSTDTNTDIGPWGLHDDILLERVEKRLDELFGAPLESPFFFTMLTLDTHDIFGKNRVSKWCQENTVDTYAEADHKIQHSVYCSDKLMSQFIRRIKSKWGDDLLIIMINDHAAYPFNVGKQLKLAQESDNRRLLFSFFDGDTLPKTISRSLSSLDLGATILGYITNNKLNTIGLGFNALNSQYSNLLEQQGMTTLNRSLQSSNFPMGKLLWDMPSFKDSDITIDTSANSLTIADNKYSLPIALMLDKNGKIIDFYGKDVRDKMALLKVSPRLVWAGKCKHIGSMVDTPGNADDTCLFVGNLTRKKYFSSVLTAPITIQYQNYEALLQSTDDLKLLNDRLYKQNNTQSHLSKIDYVAAESTGNFAVIDVFSTMSVVTSMLSYTAFPTMSERLTLQHRDRNHYGYPNGNGFYLFKINDGLVEQIYHWQTCSDKKNFDSINQVLKNHHNSQAFVLTSTRQVKCDNDDLSPYFSNSPFHSAASIEAQQPYIGFWNKTREKAHEINGPIKGNIQLRLINSNLLKQYSQL